VIVAVLIGGTLYGIVGGVFAVPVAAALHMFVTRLLAPAARNASARHSQERGHEVAQRQLSERDTHGEVAPDSS
jgi:uncharacterized membrane protein